MVTEQSRCYCCRDSRPSKSILHEKEVGYGEKEKEGDPAKIQPSMAGNTKIQLSADIYNDVSKDVASSVTDIDDVLSMLKLAPVTPTIKVNNRFEPPIYGLPQSVQDIITEICTKKQVPTEFVLRRCWR